MIDARRTTLRNPDIPLILTVAFLCVFGLMMVYSSSTSDARHLGQDSTYFFVRQARSLLVGIVALLIGVRLPYTFWKGAAVPFFVLAVALLVAVLIWGGGEGGVKRWLLSTQFQPSEIAKLAVVAFVAWWLPRKSEYMSSFNYTLIPFGVMIGFVAVLIVLEPNLGTAGVVLLSAWMMFIMAGASIPQTLGAGILGGVLLVLTAQPYQWKRFWGFPWPCDPENYGRLKQVCDGTIGLGSGGWTGLGLGASRMRWTVELPYSDLIYATIGEELGLVGASIVIVLFALLVYRGVRIALRVRDPFAQLMAAGIVFWLGTQAAINMGGNVAVLPLTGVPLPFVSFGGTSLVMGMLGVGVLLNISRHVGVETSAAGAPILRTSYAGYSSRRRNGGARLPRLGSVGGPKKGAAVR